MFCLHNPISFVIIDSWTSCSLSLSNIHNRKDRGKPFRVYVTEQFVLSVHMTAQDRRITKTRKAIYNAFLQLLNQKDYEAITVQEIIDLADVGRSTFYSHYESKELLLDELCQKLFHHLFERLNTSHHKTIWPISFSISRKIKTMWPVSCSLKMIISSGNYEKN